MLLKHGPATATYNPAKPWTNGLPEATKTMGYPLHETHLYFWLQNSLPEDKYFGCLARCPYQRASPVRWALATISTIFKC